MMDKGAVIDVSAGNEGAGGTAVLWSEEYTNFAGTILAKGGRQSGQGGQVETSSKDNLQAFGDVDVSARQGRGDSWLLDPTDVEIVNENNSNNPNKVKSLNVFSPTNLSARIGVKQITNQLNAGGNVVVQTSGHNTAGQSGNITVNAPINKTKGGDATLTLIANNNIIFYDNSNMNIPVIHSTKGALNLSLLAGKTSKNSNILLGRFFVAKLNGGDFYAGPAGNNDISLVAVNNGVINAKNIKLYTYNGFTSNFMQWNASENIKVYASFFNLKANGWNAKAQLNSKRGVEITTRGDVNLYSVTDSSGQGSVSISGDSGVSITSLGRVNIIGKDKNKPVTLNSKNGTVSISTDNALIKGKHVDINANYISLGTNNVNTTDGAISLDNANLNAKKGIRIQGRNVSNSVGAGINLRYSQLQTKDKNIYISGDTSAIGAGITFDNVTTSATNGSITAYGNGYGRTSGFEWTKKIKEGDGAINILGNTTFTAKRTVLNAKNHAYLVVQRYLDGVAGMTISDKANLTFNGHATINTTSNGSGLLFRGKYYPHNQQVKEASSTITANNGNVIINAKTTSTSERAYSYDAAVTFKHWNGQSATAHFVVNNANITVNADAGSTQLDGFSAGRNQGSNSHDRTALKNFIFSGKGNITIHGLSNSGDGLSLRTIDNSKLKGKTWLTGESQTGKGVKFQYTDANLVNTIIQGSSISNDGIYISTQDGHSKKFHLTDGWVSGHSQSGNNMVQNGDNINLTRAPLIGSGLENYIFIKDAKVWKN